MSLVPDQALRPKRKAAQNNPYISQSENTIYQQSEHEQIDAAVSKTQASTAHTSAALGVPALFPRQVVDPGSDKEASAPPPKRIKHATVDAIWLDDSDSDSERSSSNKQCNKEAAGLVVDKIDRDIAEISMIHCIYLNLCLMCTQNAYQKIGHHQFTRFINQTHLWSILTAGRRMLLCAWANHAVRAFADSLTLAIKSPQGT